MTTFNSINHHIAKVKEARQRLEWVRMEYGKKSIAYVEREKQLHQAERDLCDCVLRMSRSYDIALIPKVERM